jgi:hypothetical membrane protein
MHKNTLGGVAGPVVFFIITVVAGGIRSDYSHVHNFISELGAVGSEHAALMNVGGFMAGGALIASLGPALYRLLPRAHLTTVGSVLVLLFGLGVALSGVVSCDMGCPQGTGSTANAFHNTIAPLAFLCLITASVILGLKWRSDSQLRNLASYSIATGVIGLVLLGTLASSLESRELTGLWQRLLLLVLFSWCVVVALRMSTYEPEEPPNNQVESDA